ncbi:MAG: hypothetical protein N3A72_12295 [bacterium]|nr:hypothetical protein [bacterium]
MKKFLGLSLMVVLLASVSFAGNIVNYSFLTSLAFNVPGDPSNKVNGCVLYNPILDAAFVGQYFTGTGSRALILGWSMDSTDPTYDSVTPKYIIRERVFPNGDKLVALKSMFGNADMYGGKMHFVCDRWGFDNLNMVPRTYCPVNADSVTVTFPYVSAKYPLYNVTGISTTASTAVEDTWGGTQLYAGATAFTLIPVTCEANGWCVKLPGTQALVAVTGVFTNATGLGTNFYTGGGFDEAARTIWVNTQIPSAPRTVYVSGSFGRFDPITGVIELNAPHPPGQMLFVHVGQLQPGHRAVWKYDAATLAAETALNIYGHPVMWEPVTVANVLSVSTITTYELGGMSGVITDQFIAGKVPGFNTAKSRLIYSSYGTTMFGPITPASSTLITGIPLAGKPISGVLGVYTDANMAGINFWSSRTCAEWVPVTNLDYVDCPWGPIRTVTGIFTNINRVGMNFFTGRETGDTTSRYLGIGPGGYWSISPTAPRIYAATGGIDTTLSLGSAFVVYTGEPPENVNVAVHNLMDTTGTLILTNPLPGTPDVWVRVAFNNGLDVANNRVKVYATGLTNLLSVGDTVYICYLRQAGANPYNYTGPGTAGNRSVTANPYGVTFDKDGNYFVTSLWSYWGFNAHAANGDHIAWYPVRGSLSQVTRGQISCDTASPTQDIYWADGNGIVWRFKKTGAGLDTYVQEDLPFYLGACRGTNGTSGFRAMSSALRVKTIPAIIGGSVTLVYIGTPRDNNVTCEGIDQLTVMKTDGTIEGVYSTDNLANNGPTPRGADVAIYPDGSTRVIFGAWAGTAATRPYGQIYMWTSPKAVPVELSRFEALIN